MYCYTNIQTARKLSRHDLSLRLHTLRVVEQLLRIILRLQLLQPRQIHTIVKLIRILEPGIRIISIRAPFRLRQGLHGGIDPAVEEGQRAVGVGLVVEVAVVELDEVELVAVGIGRVLVGDLADLGELAAVDVELEEPEAVEDVAGHVEPVVDEVLGGFAVEVLDG